MISATHTHCGPGGLSHYAIYNAHPPLRGFHPQNFECVAEGILRAVTMAHAAVAPGRLRLARGRCEGASVNRAPESYLANPAEERRAFQDDVDRDMTMLRLEDAAGTCIGCVNWFAVPRDHRRIPSVYHPCAILVPSAYHPRAILVPPSVCITCVLMDPMLLRSTQPALGKAIG